MSEKPDDWAEVHREVSAVGSLVVTKQATFETAAPRRPLHRLPLGEWIDLSLVTRIYALPVEDIRPMPRVTIELGEHMGASMEFPTLAAAQAYADELAAIVNAVRSKNDAT